MAKKIKSPVTKGVAKVPVVMQMEALECGAACLIMILAYYEKWAGYQARVNAVKVQFTKANLWLTTLPNLISTLSNTIVMMLGGYYAQGRRISLQINRRW